MKNKELEVDSLQEESPKEKESSKAFSQMKGERPLSVDYFGVLTYAMVILTALAQVFLLFWLDLL
jgi:hypothetical protein